MTKKQEWAKKAFEKTKIFKDDKAFKAVANRVPGLLVQSGIVQTLSFLQSKNEKDYLETINYVYGKYKTSEELVDNIRKEALLEKYLQISHDLIECAVWIRRFMPVQENISNSYKEKSNSYISFRRSQLKNIMPQNNTNAGLWLDKYLQDNKDGAKNKNEDLKSNTNKVNNYNAKTKLFKELCTLEVSDDYLQAFKYRNELLAKQSQQNGFVTYTADAKVDGRMIVGLGQRGVTEAGITLEHTWGVPMIPGSSLKGIAAWAARQCGENWWHSEKNLPGDYFLALFGGPDSEDDDSSAKGCVTFHDAWWNPQIENIEKNIKIKLPIHLDIMTVHHKEYYETATKDKKGLGPLDTDEPVPIPFVSVNGSYRVILEGPKEWVNEAYKLLEIGLCEHGIGAKTAKGYGHLIFEIQSSKEEENLKTDKDIISRLTASDANNVMPKLVEKYKNSEYFVEIKNKARQNKQLKDFMKKKKSEQEWAAIILTD